MQALKSTTARWFILAALFMCAAPSWAQGTVKGFLKSESSGEAVMFASVTLGTTFGVSSNVDGYYSLSRVPAGTTMVVSSRYETLRNPWRCATTRWSPRTSCWPPRS